MDNLTIKGVQSRPTGKLHPRTWAIRDFSYSRKNISDTQIVRTLYPQSEVRINYQSINATANPTFGECKKWVYLIDLTAKRNFEICNRLLRNVEPCAVAIKVASFQGHPFTCGGDA